MLATNYLPIYLPRYLYYLALRTRIPSTECTRAEDNHLARDRENNLTEESVL